MKRCPADRSAWQFKRLDDGSLGRVVDVPNVFFSCFTFSISLESLNGVLGLAA